jgi:hypothetical protein
MVEIEARYDGNKKCTLIHQEGAVLHTDAPKDIGGEASATHRSFARHCRG